MDQILAPLCFLSILYTLLMCSFKGYTQFREERRAAVYCLMLVGCAIFLNAHGGDRNSERMFVMKLKEGREMMVVPLFQ